jgi:hypothetical protein
MVQVVDAVAGEIPGELFSSFDSVRRGTLAAKAVRGAVIRKGLPVSLNIQVCESASELARALEIDSSVSLSFGRAFNATAKMNFMNSLNVTENNVAIVVYVRNGTGRFEATEVALLPEEKAPSTDAEVVNFFSGNGDSYVSAVSQGGEYYAVYTFRTTTRAEKTNLTASLKLGGVSGALKFDSETQVKLTNFMKSTQVSWTFRQEMTGVTGISLPKSEDMIAFGLDFSKLTMNTPVTTAIAIRHYEDIPNFGNAFNKLTENRHRFTEEKGILARFARLGSLQEQIKRLRDIYSVYGFDKDPGLDALSPMVEADRETIEQQTRAWRSNPLGSFASPELRSLARGEPILDFEDGENVSFGSRTGDNFEFMPVEDAFRNHVRIESVQLADGEWGSRGQYHVIRRLKVGYSSPRGKWEVSHGLGGAFGETLFLREGEFPSRLVVGHGGLIDSIEVQAGRRTIKGGGPNGTIVEWKPEPGSVVLGFAGRAGGALDQIRIIHARLKPARYRLN